MMGKRFSLLVNDYVLLSVFLYKSVWDTDDMDVISLMYGSLMTLKTTFFGKNLLALITSKFFIFMN